jgi:long-chain acyl-CoA synthetase
MSAVELRDPQREAASAAASLPGLLLAHGRERPRELALRHKRLGRWREYDWEEYAARAARVGLGLLELGLEAGDRVAVHSQNRPAWLLADLGTQGIGAITVGIYPTSPAAEVEYLLAHSGARVLVAEDQEQVDKALAVRARLPELERIVVVDPRGIQVDEGEELISFDRLEELGDRREPDEFRDRVAGLDPTETAIIVYTSGTTGPPKGAMLTHGNLTAAGEALERVYDIGPRDEVLSYLPLCHVAERLVSVIDALRSGYVVNFGEGLETFTQDLSEIQPTFFLGVPRVWEKVMAGVEIRVADASVLKRAAYRLALRVGRWVAARRLRGTFGPVERLAYGVGWVLAFGPLREKLGLRRVRVALSGAAPIAPSVLEFLWAIGVAVREGYGQTENTAMATFMPVDDVRLGTVGRALPGVEIAIADDGEILTRSAGVFAGYYRDADATAAAVDADGWLHTGDVGELDEDGFLRITDRKKDIMITAGGKNVSPSEIENRLKVSPYVREAIVVGDRRKFLAALVGIEGDVVGDWASRHGIPYTTYADLSSNRRVRELVGGVVDGVNAEVAQVERIKRFELLPEELDQEDGQLTATQKVKRAAISEQFSELIERMYR